MVLPSILSGHPTPVAAQSKSGSDRLQSRNSDAMTCRPRITIRAWQNRSRRDRWSRSDDLSGRVILALTQRAPVAQQAAGRPPDVAALGDHLRAPPMDPAEHRRRAETTTARRW